MKNDDGAGSGAAGGGSRKGIGGRPTLYRPEYCETVMSLGAKGYSRARMAAHIGVSKQTLKVWENDHPEFLDALSRATTLSQAWHEELAAESYKTREFNTPLWSQMVKSMFREDHGDRIAQEQSGPDGGPIRQEQRIEWVIVRPKGTDD
jgi:DNA-binding XRE family transcriptional regulator